MTTTNMQPDASASERQNDHAADDASPSAADEAKQILAKARYEAFRLMTDAREEAEEILEQARAEAASIRNEAELQAESIVDAAHMQADEVRGAAPPPEPTETAESVAQLEQEHEELTERVTSLRALADQLEERFAALAANAAAPRAELDEPPRPVLDYSPSVPPPPREPQVVVDDADPPSSTESEPAERGSFYSRRSAKLPRIGDAGGHSALDMMRSIREAFDES